MVKLNCLSSCCKRTRNGYLKVTVRFQAQVPLYRDVPVFPRLSAPEWDEVIARQDLLVENNDYSAVPAGFETQPGNLDQLSF